MRDEDDKKVRDGFSEITFDLAMDEIGAEVVRNEETGAVALFPKTMTSEEEWEQKSIAMHERNAAEYDAWLAEQGFTKEDSPGGAERTKTVIEDRPEIKSKVRGMKTGPVFEDGTSGPDHLPEHHRTGHTIPLNVTKV